MAFGLSAGAIGLIGAGAGLVAGGLGANASKSAANTQANSQSQAIQAQEAMNNDNINLQKELFQKQVDLQQPWNTGGQLYLNKLMYMLGQTPTQDSSSTDPNFGSLSRPFSLADFQADPGYQFRQQQGQQALERSAAARGGLMSGKTLKDLDAYSQGLASQEYGNAYDRYNNNNNLLFNRYASLAGIGQTAANNLSSGTAGLASNIGNIMSNTSNAVGQGMVGIGNAQAAGTVGSANALSSGLASGWNAFSQNQLMNRLFPPGGSSSGFNQSWLGGMNSTSDPAYG